MNRLLIDPRTGIDSILLTPELAKIIFIECVKFLFSLESRISDWELRFYHFQTVFRYLIERFPFEQLTFYEPIKLKKPKKPKWFSFSFFDQLEAGYLMQCTYTNQEKMRFSNKWKISFAQKYVFVFFSEKFGKRS